MVSFIKTNANMSEDYIKSLKTTWKAVHDEAIKQGLILSYKILVGTAANPEDWDIMLLAEYKNLASMDGTEDKWDAIEKKVVGNDDAQKKLNETRVNMRTIYGGKMLREVIFN
jgi:5-bromo-4-chloroindolyl phosphate hydrolysis protein